MQLSSGRGKMQVKKKEKANRSVEYVSGSRTD
jgi:hypothetical protein